MQLHLHQTNYTTPQLQLHYTTTTATAALHHTTSSSCGWADRPADHCNHRNHSKKHSSNHLSVHQWIRSAIRDSQQPISPNNYNYSCTTPHYIQQLWVSWPTSWPLQPSQPLQKTQLQPPFGPSVDSLCHPWFATTNLSYRFPIFETSATALCGTTTGGGGGGRSSSSSSGSSSSSSSSKRSSSNSSSNK